MINLVKRVFASSVLFLVTVFPVIVLAQTTPFLPLVPKCNTWDPAAKKLTDPCGWTFLITLADNILQFMVYISVPIAAIAFAYAGWLYLSARGNSGQITKAHGIFENVGIGLVITLTAALVVKFILTSLADPASYISVFR